MDITVEETADEDGTRTQYVCDEYEFWFPLTRDAMVRKVVAQTWDNDREQKLVNEYNAAVLGLTEGEEAEAAVSAYREFLAARAELKARVEADCDSLGIR